MNSRHMLQLSDRARSLVLALMLVATFALTGCSHKQADADRLAAMLQIKPGMVVADVGAGSGWMTVMMGGLCRAQGPRFFDRDRSAGAGQNPQRGRRGASGNVTVVQATASDTGLPADCCDAIILRRVYHHLTDPADTDRSLLQRLASGRPTGGAGFPPQHPDVAVDAQGSAAES